MKHFTLPRFWQLYAALPPDVQKLADKQYALLQSDSRHLSLQFKKIKARGLWSVRVNDDYHALGRDTAQGIVWVWIGTHADYDKLIR